MKAIEKIKLLKEHAELVQSIPAMKAVQRIKSLKRLSEIVVALGGAIASSEPEYNFVNHRGKTDIDTLFEVATSRGDGNHSFTNLAKVTNETAQKIKNVLGVDVTGFDIGIDESSIRHVLKEHGDPEVERKRGQTAVVEQDFALVAEIVNNADKILKGDVDSTIVFEKKIGVDYIVVEELRIGKGKLSLKTMYKKGLTSVLIAPDKNQSIAETSETVGSLAHEQSITEASGNFKGNLSQDFYELLIDSNDVGYSDSDILTSEDLGDYDLTPLEKQLLENKTVAFGRAIIAIDKICTQQNWRVVFNDFNSTLNHDMLFDSANVDNFDVVAQVSYQDKICRVSIDTQGYCYVLRGATGAKTVANKAIHYDDIVLLKVFYHVFSIDKDIEVSDLNDKQKELLDKYQDALQELQKYDDEMQLSFQLHKVQEWERVFNGAKRGNVDDLKYLVKNATDYSRFSATRKALSIFTDGELLLNSRVNQVKSEQLIRAYFADTNKKLLEIEVEQVKAEIARQEAEKQAKQAKDMELNGQIYQAFAGKSDVEIGRAKNQLHKTVATREFGSQTYKAFIENLIDNHGYKPSQEEFMKRKGENAGDTKTVYRIADDKGNGYEINKTHYAYAKWYYEQKAPMQGNEMSEPTSQAVAQVLVSEYGWQYNSNTSITLGRYINDKFGEFTVSADVKDDDIIANQPLTNVFIGGVRDVVQDAKDFHRRALDWLDSFQSKPVGNENEPNNEQDMNNPNYTQSDIDYLQSIINGTLDLETVDMDKMIEIGEKDEHDPMYEQALQIISDYEDEMTKDI